MFILKISRLNFIFLILFLHIITIWQYSFLIDENLNYLVYYEILLLFYFNLFHQLNKISKFYINTKVTFVKAIYSSFVLIPIFIYILSLEYLKKDVFYQIVSILDILFMFLVNPYFLTNTFINCEAKYNIENSKNSYIEVLFFIFFLPIGFWFLLPRFNKIFSELNVNKQQ